MDVLILNELIFGNKAKESIGINQKYKSYDSQTIHKILNYQRNQGLSNVELANYFKISRNTIANWKKKFKKE